MAGSRAPRGFAAAIFASLLLVLAAAPSPTRASSSSIGPMEVDTCDACAASASAFHDALEHRRAKLHARYGDGGGSLSQNPPRYLRFGDFPDAPAAAREAVQKACGPRGRWLRFSIKSVGVGDGEGGGLAFLALSGPGLDAEHIPGIQRPADEKDTKALSTHLRRMCVAEAERIGVENLIDAFDETFDSGTTPERLQNDSGTSDESNDESRTTGDENTNAYDPAAAFAARVCVEGWPGGSDGTGESPPGESPSPTIRDPPCRRARSSRKARALAAAADDAAALDRRSNAALRDVERTKASAARCGALAAEAGRKMSEAARGVGKDGAAYVIGGDTDASLGLQPSEMSAVRSCASLARALMQRGRATASADVKDVAWVDAVADYDLAAVAWPAYKAEAEYLGARAYARFDHPGGFASTDPNSDETVGVDRHARLLRASRRAAKAVKLDATDPDARITFADVAALVREDADALEQYRYASGLLPLAGERSAAVATSRAAASSAVAHQFATYLRQMEKFESLAENRTLVAKMAETRIEAEVLGRKRSLQAAEDILAALTQAPTRRRHVAMAAAAVVYSAWMAEPVDVRAAEAGPTIGAECDDDRPPVGCYGVMLNHARNMMELELWELARQAAHYAVKAKGEKWKKKKDAGEIIAEAERKMEAAVGSRSAADANAGKRWREKVREQLRASGAENLHAAIHQDLHDEHDEL